MKRSREEEAKDVDLLPNDTIVGFNLLSRSSLVGEMRAIMRHHLYSVIENRSIVDQQLFECRDEGLLRILDAGIEEIIVKESDFRKNILIRATNSEDSETKLILRMFANDVLKAEKGKYVDQNVLNEMLPSKWCSVLSITGYLTKHRGDSYCFAFHGLCTYVSELHDCRKLILETLHRKRNKEISTTEIKRVASNNNKKIANTKSRKPNLADASRRLGIDFHIMDLVESGNVRCIDIGNVHILKNVT